MKKLLDDPPRWLLVAAPLTFWLLGGAAVVKALS
jgi:hypothetical protein